MNKNFDKALDFVLNIVDEIDKDCVIYVYLDSMYELESSDNINEYSLWLQHSRSGKEVFFDFFINGNKKKRFGLPKVNEIKKAVKQILN
ncbi:hypothetical protein DCO58_11905 [Helicobacter saguini]|nr:hypothetical protein [Helicobacter saguini]MWV61007.1 hypothetical protein [Helicobacter saguini]MWV68324.1 hypothetical protein [Helicobacter saguini]MWV70211.1 hypothetical protein [Helicobacter saguini]MWV72114.1 hypothetical protein [Helicobacter saguini]